MAIDWFGFNKRREAMKREIADAIDGQREGKARLHDWSPSEQNDGRDQRVSYRTLESIYKKESWKNR